MGDVHLIAIERRESGRGFPFSVPAIRDLERVELSSSVTFLVGENGAGKSTLLEAIAAAARLPTVGSDEVTDDATLQAQRRLARALRLVWRRGRAQRGFFLRAEDFFGFTRRLARQRAQLQQRLEEVQQEFADASPHTRSLAALPAAASLHEMEARYGADLDAMSHGQSFLQLFRARFVPHGLFLLDEPEAALSPTSQLALLAMLRDAVGEGGQFLIATHSPILLAHPGARILSFDQSPPAEVAWDETTHVRLTREFLAEPERYLRHL